MGGGRSRGPAQRRLGGNVTIVVALCLVMLLGFVALAFDLAYVRLARFQLQNANDAAGHAAIVQLRQTGSLAQARAAAKSVALQNPVADKGHLTLSDSDVVFGGWDFARRAFSPGSTYENAVQVNGNRTSANAADGPIALFFGKVLGTDHADARESAVAALRPRNIIIAQDITGSFLAAIDTAAVADVAMLDMLHQFDLPTDRVGMQMFTGASAQFGPAALQYVHSDYGQIYQLWYGDGLLVDNAAKRSGITLCNKLDLTPPDPNPWYQHAWVPHCSAGGDGTDISSAIFAATSVLVSQGGPDAVNVIVVFTDGLPECCAPGGQSCDYVQSHSCPAARAKAGLDAADAAALDGISIFTVFYTGSLSDPSLVSAGIAYNRSLVRGIGKAYNTPDKKQLAAILSTIAGSIPISLVQ